MRRSLVLVLAALAGCGDARVEALQQRLRALELQVEAQRTALQQHGIPVYAGPARDAAEQVERQVAALQQALDDLESAKDTRDATRGQTAMQTIDAAIRDLQQQPQLALPALLAASQQAPAQRQPAVLECYARVGGAGVAPELLALLGDPAQPAGLRQQAGRSLLACDPGAGIAAVGDLLAGRIAPLPELYLLVHLAAATSRPEAVPVLLTALQHSQDRSVRCHAATGLGNFPGTADALATAATGDEYPAVRANALRALQKLDGARAAAVATELLQRETDASVRAAATAVQTAGKR